MLRFLHMHHCMLQSEHEASLIGVPLTSLLFQEVPQSDELGKLASGDVYGSKYVQSKSVRFLLRQLQLWSQFMSKHLDFFWLVGQYLSALCARSLQWGQSVCSLSSYGIRAC